MPTGPQTPAKFRFDEFSVDTDQRTLMRGAEHLALPSRAFDTLAYLLKNRGRCVPKDELIAAIWHDVVVTDDSLIHAISVLRRVLGDGRQESRYIQTVPRRGYRFVGTLDRPETIAVPTSTAESTAVAPLSPSHAVPPPVRAAAQRPDRWLTLLHAGLVAGATGAVTAVLALVLLDRPEPAQDAGETASIRLYQTAPAGTRIVSGGVLSPDGGQLAFVARDESRGQTALWLRTLGSSRLRRIESSAGASKPFWSPDSRRIAFFANGALWVADVAGGAPRAIAPAFAAAGGTWASDGTILFAEWTSGLVSVPATGDGDIRTVLPLERDAEDIALGSPQFLPDGRRFIYQVVSLDAARTGVYIGDLDGARPIRLLESASPAVYAPPRHLLHVREDMLIAEEFDPERLQLTGRAFVVARGLSPMSLTADNIVSASAELLAFQHGVTQQNLGWFDRDGAPLGTLALPTALFNPRISPDGSRLLSSGTVTSNPGLWLARLDREQFLRLETDAMGPVWSHDGERIAFTSRRGLDVIVRAADGDQRDVLASDDNVKILNDWTPDGTALLYTRHDAATGLDLWLTDVRSGRSRSLLATQHNETQARISPDGRFVAYASDETGTLETYVARFPGLEEPKRISTAGGGQPQWRADSGEIYYLAADRALMAVGIRQGNPIGLTPPQRLFYAPVTGDPGDAREYYAAAADGMRFLIDGAVSENDGQSITIMVNWLEGAPSQPFDSARAATARR